LIRRPGGPAGALNYPSVPALEAFRLRQHPRVEPLLSLGCGADQPINGSTDQPVANRSTGEWPMPLQISTTLLLNYTLLLARSAGFVVFLPVPGMRSFPVSARLMLAILLTVLAAPLASGVSDAGAILDTAAAVWVLSKMILAEAALGVALGAAVALLLEAFGLAAQILGFQAGYSYVNMVDPTTQVDASILNVMIALLSSLLFFTFDLHLHLLRAWIAGIENWPLGSFVTRPIDAWRMIQLGGLVFETSVRLAFPIIAVLLLIDLTLGLLNQINGRLQLLTLAFPSKILGAVALLYPVLLLAPRLFHELSERTYEVIWTFVQR
jgi:flagellar biosynthesis protein FliR